MKFKGLAFLCIMALLFSCGKPEIPKSVYLAYEKLPEKIDFNQHVKPILSDKCFICHGPDEAKVEAGLQLHDAERAYAELTESPGKFAIKPGSLRKSEMFHRIVTDDPNYIMPEPASHMTLSDYEKAVLIKWIEEGAEYKDHWAFIKPLMPKVPNVEQDELIANAIDNFIVTRLQQEKLKPSAKADKEILLRRLSFDLTGLPPTLDEIDNFLEDDSPEAYEKQVDRLLASSHYGEQMALDWMDLSRFADTHGYSVDRYRDMSPWRDWVIKSFNENMPYDEFIKLQLAGDLMENPSTEMKLATAFNRIHPQNMEGGIIGEEFLVEYAVDRASTIGQAFMGLTVACARCHDHKYDPISHKNFYEMTTFFNNVNEAGQISYNNALPVPTLLLTTEEEEKTMAYINGLMEDTKKEVSMIENEVISTDFEKWLAKNSFQSILNSNPTDHLVANYDLNDKSLKNKKKPKEKGTMKREYRAGQPINLVEGKRGKGLIFNGDTWLDLKNTAVFGRNDAFSISLWANIPSALEKGNIFHKGEGAVLYAWRGYHLRIVDNKLELMMAHTYPDNAIVEISKDNFPRDIWVHFTVTYDGSSKASGYKLFLNGKEMETSIKTDNLYKDILFRNGNEPGLQLGARLRGKGISGGVIDEIKVYDKALSLIEIMQLAESDVLEQFKELDAAALTENQKELLQSYYINTISSKGDGQNQKLAELRKTYVDSVESIKEVMVMKETNAPVQSYVLDRGVYDAKAEKVYPNTPEAILKMPNDYPKNRLGFAKWLFHEDHPLTDRVAVNRFWQHYFGTGLVKTSEDFGNQGELPSHPELLDWLAVKFKNSKWDVKALQKLIVMSNTYQQSSTTKKELLEKDIENRLLAKGPSKRLTGEMLRDNALATSGLLNYKIGGESVKPYQPKGLWSVNGSYYKEDIGEKLYRRSMYTIWKRSVPHPTLATFDAPARDVCTIRRQKTNTPLQALVLLNDPTYIEAARVFGKSMLSYKNNKEAIGTVFKKLTGRTIKPNELELLTQLQEEEYENFNKNPEKAKGWLNSGEFRISKNDNAALVAANAVVASTIMNSDATITKR